MFLHQAHAPPSPRMSPSSSCFFVTLPLITRTLVPKCESGWMEGLVQKWHDHPERFFCRGGGTGCMIVEARTMSSLISHRGALIGFPPSAGVPAYPRAFKGKCLYRRVGTPGGVFFFSFCDATHRAKCNKVSCRPHVCYIYMHEYSCGEP